MRQISNEQEMKSWEAVGNALAESKNHTVSEVLAMVARDEKDRVYQTIDNCMIVLKNDPVLKGAICHNDLTCKMDLRKDLGWGLPDGGGIRDVDINQIEWYLERTYGLKNYKAIGKALNIIASENHFHPIKDYLEGLKWDGVSRVAEFLPKYLGADRSAFLLDTTN